MLMTENNNGRQEPVEPPQGSTIMGTIFSALIAWFLMMLLIFCGIMAVQAIRWAISL